MAEFVEVMKHKKRMCDTLYCKGHKCTKCQMDFENNGKFLDCRTFVIDYPQEAEEIIMKWAKENPVKTNADVFRETFGHEIAKNPHGCSGINCPNEQYVCDSCTLNGFWNKEYKEPKGDK